MFAIIQLLWGLGFVWGSSDCSSAGLNGLTCVCPLCNYDRIVYRPMCRHDLTDYCFFYKFTN